MDDSASGRAANSVRADGRLPADGPAPTRRPEPREPADRGEVGVLGGPRQVGALGRRPLEEVERLRGGRVRAEGPVGPGDDARGRVERRR